MQDIYKPKDLLASLFLLEPTLGRKALKVLERKTVRKNEYDSLISNGTWTVFHLSKVKKIIENKWVFRTKLKVHKSLDKYKSIIVTKGFKQTK